MMEPVVQMVVQLGSLGLLAHIIIWWTQKGGPGLFDAMNGIRDAIKENTAKLSALEERQEEHTDLLAKLVSKVGFDG